MTAAVAVPIDGALAERPTRDLPRWQLFELSLYWLGINVLMGGLELILQPRTEALVGTEHTGAAIAVRTIIGTIVAIIVQPTVGAISDHTISRWGRRKPYILIGAALDVVFLLGIALSDSYVSLVMFVALLQFSSNFAQGPFQGYVPDLVPAKQVGLASGLMGVMIMLGRVIGTAIGTIGLYTGNYFVATLGLAVLELGTGIATVLTVDEGRPPRPRGSRSWVQIALSAWGLDILRERNFVWLLASRLFVLMGPSILVNFIVYYLTRSHGLTHEEAATWSNIALVPVAIATLCTTYPAARLSDRLGRKALIYASCGIGAVGMLGLGLAPALPIAVAFAVVVGISAGAFLAVDWALMTDIIPKAESGRYMGISNLASAASGPIALTFAGLVMDAVTQIDPAAGPRLSFLIALAFYAIGAALLGPVRERRPERI